MLIYIVWIDTQIEVINELPHIHERLKFEIFLSLTPLIP